MSVVLSLLFSGALWQQLSEANTPGVTRSPSTKVLQWKTILHEVSSRGGFWGRWLVVTKMHSRAYRFRRTHQNAPTHIFPCSPVSRNLFWDSWHCSEQPTSCEDNPKGLPFYFLLRGSIVAEAWNVKGVRLHHILPGSIGELKHQGANLYPKR